MAATSRGIDVSDYQGAQDWQALVRSGVTFAMVKATEGEHTRFDHYPMHMAGMLAAGVLPGAYHYAWPNQDPRAEADNYIAAVRENAEAHPGFMHWLDQERREDGKNYAGVTNAQIRAYATAWVARVKAAFPRQRVGVYTSGSDITAAHYPANSDALWYPAYPAGAMTYTQAEQRTRPAPGGIRALFWQFTSTPIDRSICYLTPAALRAWAGLEDDMPLTPADAKLVATEVFELMTAPAGRDRMAMAVMYALNKALDDSKLDAKSDASGVITQVAALRPKLKALAGGGAMSDAQAQAVAAELATDPKFAKTLADALGADLAARLQS